MSFSAALALVLALEGGYSNHPADPGGATNYGITQAAYDSWRRGRGLDPQPVARIDRREVDAIYRERYWEGEPQRWDELGHPGVALYLFDMRIQHGRWRDIYEPHREALVNYPLLGLAQLRQARMRYYTSLAGWATFGRGWARREAAVYAEAVNQEHPRGLLRAEILNLNGVEWDIGIARIVRRTIWARGTWVTPPCPWWRRVIGRCDRG